MVLFFYVWFHLFEWKSKMFRYDDQKKPRILGAHDRVTVDRNFHMQQREREVSARDPNYTWWSDKPALNWTPSVPYPPRPPPRPRPSAEELDPEHYSNWSAPPARRRPRPKPEPEPITDEERLAYSEEKYNVRGLTFAGDDEKIIEWRKHRPKPTPLSTFTAPVMQKRNSPKPMYEPTFTAPVLDKYGKGSSPTFLSKFSLL